MTQLAPRGLDRPMLDPKSVIASLVQLRRSTTKVFGAEGHQFRLNDVVRDSEIASFEKRHSVRLPDDYRHFLSVIGNGGAGPFYGIFQLGTMRDPGWNNGVWQDEVGNLAAPFPYRQEGLLREETGEGGPFVIGPHGYRRRVADRSVLNDEDPDWFAEPVNGAFPICHMGCADYIWLVVTGESRGELWHDGRAAGLAFEPLRSEDGQVLKFGRWYQSWLEQSLRNKWLFTP